MTREEKIAVLEEMLELDEGSLTESTKLNEIESWDSLAVISFITIMDEKFGKTLSSDRIKRFKTVGDVIDEMSQE